MLKTQDILTNIKKVFIEQEKYLFDKYVPEFMVNDKLLGDSYNQMAVEPRGKNPPRFYYNISPFDVISKTTPDQAIAFENGQLILNVAFADYVKIRTAAMEAIVLEALGVKSLKDKKILIIGVGKIAQHVVRILKESYPDMDQLDVVSHSGNFDVIKDVGQKCKVTVSEGSLETIQIYDIVMCHTKTENIILTEGHMKKIKQGAIVTTFIDPSVSNEVASAFYDSSTANIIGDWDQTLTRGTDLAEAIKIGLTKEEDVVMMKDLLSGKWKVDTSKRYTIYRSTGTPIQNLAVLQLLVGSMDA